MLEPVWELSMLCDIAIVAVRAPVARLADFRVQLSIVMISSSLFSNRLEVWVSVECSCEASELAQTVGQAIADRVGEVAENIALSGDNAGFECQATAQRQFGLDFQR